MSRKALCYPTSGYKNMTKIITVNKKFLSQVDRVCVGCLFLRSPSRIPYRTELIPRAPTGRRTRTPHP